MKKTLDEKVERIISLVEWFEEFQPKDLEQIERLLLGLQYVDEDVVKSELRKDIYNSIKNTKLDKSLRNSYYFIDLFFRKDANERNKLEK